MSPFLVWKEELSECIGKICEWWMRAEKGGEAINKRTPLSIV
jgi:hypothetical protein